MLLASSREQENLQFNSVQLKSEAEFWGWALLKNLRIPLDESEDLRDFFGAESTKLAARGSRCLVDAAKSSKTDFFTTGPFTATLVTVDFSGFSGKKRSSPGKSKEELALIGSFSKFDSVCFFLKN